MFSLNGKTMYCEGHPKNMFGLNVLIDNGFNNITPDDCDGYYQKMLSYISRALSNEIVLDWINF